MNEQWNSPEEPQISPLMLGSVAHRQGQYEQARKHYLEAFQQAESEQNFPELYTVSYHLGKLLIDLNELDEAQKILQNAVRLRRENDESIQSVVSAISDLQDLLFKRGKLDDVESLSIDELNWSLSAYGADSFQYNMASMSTGLMYWNYLKDLEKCKRYFELALKFARSHSNSTVRKVVLMNYAEVLTDAKQTAEAEAIKQELNRRFT
ncbi:MAG: tetratricopeptide repeat protein [Candidatus Obscuribacterales bacterium]